MCHWLRSITLSSNVGKLDYEDCTVVPVTCVMCMCAGLLNCTICTLNTASIGGAEIEIQLNSVWII